MKRIVLYIGVLLWACALQAQNYTSSDKKAIRLFENGQRALYQGKSDAALNYFEQAVAADDDFLEAHLMLAELWHDAANFETEQSGDPQTPSARQYREKAKIHYYAVTDKRRDFFAPAWSNLGKLELADGNYDKAIICYETYLGMDKPDGESLQEAKRDLEAARFRREAVAHPVAFNPQNMGAAVNSSSDEYLPALTADGKTLVFTRRLPRRATTTARTPEEEDFYLSRQENGQWTKAERMPEPVNSNDNEGAQCISQDGRIMFFTACDRPGGAGRCDLYMCIRRGDQWGKPRNLGAQVNSGAWESQPSFSIDGKTLYFVSDRKGGHGGMDLWRTVFENGAWTAPENLGPEINSDGNEMTPFISYDDKTLYFSSNGHPGMGGMDLFVSHRQADGSWSKPENLGYPINDSGDETGLIVSADGRTALYASQRKEGYGRQDLWYFELPEAVRPTVAICFTGTVTDAKSGKKVAADIKVVDINEGRVVANTSSDAQNGQYIVSLPADGAYAFHVSADGYLLHSQSEVWKRDDNYENWKPITVDIALHPIESGERIALRNVFFETGKWELLEGSQYELDKVVELLTRNPQLRIELGGHTDNVGRPEANQKLSEQRAKAVYDYLTGKGIASERLTYKGYGETQAVADNDTETGRSENRRTEIKVL